MPTTISTGAGRCDVAVDPDEGASLAFAWPSALTGRTFAAALDDGTALTTVVDTGAGTVTVTWPAGIVAMTGWKLRETTSTPRTKLSGKVVPLARTPSSGTVQVHDADAVPVDVTVVGGPGPKGDDGAPGADATAIYGDPVAIVHGGTGATTAPAARAALGLDTAATHPATDFDAAGAAAAEAARATAAEATLAPLASPALTGNPTAPTQTPANNSARVATTAYADAAIAALVNSAPGTLDTLGEIATALQADESGAAALATTVAGKLAKAANLSDVADAAVARTNLGLDTAATHAATDFDAAGAAAAAQAASQPHDADLDSLATGGATATTWLRALLDAAYAAVGDPLTRGFVSNAATFLATTLTSANGVGVAGQGSYSRLTVAGHSMSSVVTDVVASANNVCFAVFGSTGVGRSLVPTNRKATTGSVPCPSIGMATIALDGTITPVITDFAYTGIDGVTCSMSLLTAFAAANTWAMGLGQFHGENTFPAPTNAAPIAQSSAVGATWRFNVLVGV